MYSLINYLTIMSEKFYGVSFRRSEKEKEGEVCYVANHKVYSNNTSSGSPVLLREVFIISSHKLGDSRVGRVDEPGVWNVECIESKKTPGVHLVKNAQKDFDRVKLELNGRFLNIIVNGKLAVHYDKDGNKTKLGYTGIGATEADILRKFYQIVPNLNLSPDFSVNSFEKEFYYEAEKLRRGEFVMPTTEKKRAKRPRIQRG